jgi:hypothetical protein
MFDGEKRPRNAASRQMPTLRPQLRRSPHSPAGRVWKRLQRPYLDGDLSWDHHDLLVGGDWNMNFMTFHSVGNFISSQLTKSMIFQRGRYTTNQFTKKNVDLYGVVYPTTEKFHGISFS